MYSRWLCGWSTRMAEWRMEKNSGRRKFRYSCSNDGAPNPISGCSAIMFMVVFARKTRSSRESSSRMRSCGMKNANHSEPTMAAVSTAKSVRRRPRFPSFRKIHSAPAAAMPRSVPREPVSLICQPVTPAMRRRDPLRQRAFTDQLSSVGHHFHAVRTANDAVIARSEAFQLMFPGRPKSIQCRP